MAVFHSGWGCSRNEGNTLTGARKIFFASKGWDSWVVMLDQEFQSISNVNFPEFSVSYEKLQVEIPFKWVPPCCY